VLVLFGSGSVLFDRPGAFPHDGHSPVSGSQDVWPDASPDTVVSARLFGRDAWPGTWLWRPVVALAWPGALPIPNQRHRRRRFVGRSWGIGDRIGSFREMAAVLAGVSVVA